MEQSVSSCHFPVLNTVPLFFHISFTQVTFKSSPTDSAPIRKSLLAYCSSLAPHPLSKRWPPCHSGLLTPLSAKTCMSTSFPLKRFSEPWSFMVMLLSLKCAPTAPRSSFLGSVALSQTLPLLDGDLGENLDHFFSLFDFLAPWL